MSLPPVRRVHDEEADLTGSCGIGVASGPDRGGTHDAGVGVERDQQAVRAWLQECSTPLPRDFVGVESLEHLLGKHPGVRRAPGGHLRARHVVDIGGAGEAHGVRG